MDDDELDPIHDLLLEKRIVARGDHGSVILDPVRISIPEAHSWTRARRENAQRLADAIARRQPLSEGEFMWEQLSSRALRLAIDDPVIAGSYGRGTPARASVIGRRLPELPGATLTRLAKIVCSPSRFERVFEPIIADMQHEYLEARTAGRPVAAWLARAHGWVAFLRAAGLVKVLAFLGLVWRELRN